MINVNDNYGIQAPKPIDARYGPYDTIAEALAAIPLYQRYLGLTIGIDINNIEEYWWQDGLTDGDLVAKLPSINYPVTSVNGQTGDVMLDSDDIPQGVTNEYFTQSKVRATILTGLSTAINAIISATDSVLSAFGKLQAQITANLSTLSAHISNTNNPHSVTLAQVTSAGNTTTNAITVGDITFNNLKSPFSPFGNLITVQSNDGGRLYFNNINAWGLNGFSFGGIDANFGNGQTITFHTNSTERMRINPTTGNVGIATATDAGYKLDVNGTARIQNYLYVNPNNAINSRIYMGDRGAYLYGYFTEIRTNGNFGTDGNLTANGNIIVASLNQQYNGKFYLALGQGNGYFAQSLGGLKWSENGRQGTHQGAYIEAATDPIYSATAAPTRIMFGTAPVGSLVAVERLRILANGNVLIGTTTDSGYKLDVNGTARVQNVLQLGRLTADPATAANGDIYYNTTTNKFRGYENGAWTNLI